MLMKHKIFVAIFLFVCSVLSKPIYAQTDEDAIKVAVGGSFAKPKIMPKLEKLAIAQITVNYKLTTKVSTIGKEKSSGKMAGAKLTAFLETTDGELSPADFQEVTDYFYSYFQKALKARGIDTVAWSNITNKDFYKDADEKIATNEEERSNGNVWVTYNANKGNTIYGGGIVFAFGKIKKAARFADEIGAPGAYFHLTVDFADVLVNVEINTKESGYATSFYPYTSSTTTTKFKAYTRPNMKVTPSTLGNTLLWNEKQQGETIIVDKDIESKAFYHTAVNQDPSRLKNNLFGFAKSMDPVVIETTCAQYKEAAKKALERYADAFIAKAVEMKKD